MINVGCVILAGIFWGVLSLPLNALQNIGFSVFQCAGIRIFFTTLILGVFLLFYNKKLFIIQLKDLPFFIGMGLCSLGSTVFYLWDISEIGSSSVPALLLDTSPIFVLILSILFFKEKITLRKIVSLILTCVGVVFVTGVLGNGNNVSFKIVIIGLLSGISYASYSIFNKFVAKKYDPLTIVFYAFCVGSIVYVPFCGIIKQVDLLFSVKSIIFALCLAGVCTVIPFSLYSFGLKKVPASKVSILANSELICASVVGIIFFHESFTLLKVLGFLLVIFAIILLSLNKNE